MEDKFAENLALLVCFAKRMESVAREMQKVCADMLESLQVTGNTIPPEDYE